MAAVYSVVAKNGSTFLFLACTTLHFSKLLLGPTSENEVNYLAICMVRKNYQAAN